MRQKKERTYKNGRMIDLVRKKNPVKTLKVFSKIILGI
jgi:hypothetical protein